MSRPTLDPAAVLRFRVRGFHPLRLAFPKPFCYPLTHLCSPNPGSKLPVCPLSLSLAATQEIDVSFSSSGYLDVSVLRVAFVWLCIHHTIPGHCSRWVAPFGNLRVYGYLLLTAAYRSLSRPSSAPDAKASALCSFSLDLVNPLRVPHDTRSVIFSSGFSLFSKL